MRVLRIVIALGCLFVAVPALYADVKTEGEITGVVLDPEGRPLPGATVALSGEKLIQKSLTQTSNEKGAFRFPNLKPGSYAVAASLQGVGEQQAAAVVNVGRTTSVEVRLGVARAAEEVTVRATASLVDKTSPQISTNFTEQTLRQLPVGRNREFIELVDITPAVNDRGGAFGTGGWFDPETLDAKFERGAPSSSYQLNGVNVSNLEYGTTPINPDLDTVQEVQVVGPGATAEYGDFTGVVVNLVTKSGTNEFHGSVSGYYTNTKLEADNSGGIEDLQRGDIDYIVNSTATLGGPIVREKLLFFAALGYHPSSQAPPRSTAYADSERISYHLRLDFLASTRHNFSGLFTREPIDETNLGIPAGGGEELGYFYDVRTDSGYASWQATWGRNTLTELKYAGFKSFTLRVPNEPDVPPIYDYRTGRQYGSNGAGREFRNRRDQGIAHLTHYVEDFLGGSHDIKVGVEYEDAFTEDFAYITGNSFIYMFPLGGDLLYVGGALYDGSRHRTDVRGVSAFAQDKVTFGSRLTLNVGLRYDNPYFEDVYSGQELVEFQTVAPRLGLSYDPSGRGETVFHLSYGRYYAKVLAYGIPFFAGGGGSPANYYNFVTTDPIDPLDPTLPDRLFAPENFSYTYRGSSIPIDPDLDNQYSDVITAGAEHSFGSRFAVGIRYIYKEDNDFIVVEDRAQHTYEPFPYTNPINGETLTLFSQTDTNPIDYFFTNDDFYFQKHHFVILEARTQPSAKLAFQGSLTWERNTGTLENNFSAPGAFGGVNASNDPNYRGNPFNEGVLTYDRTWQFKLLGTYQLPWRFYVSGDFRWLSGRTWTPVNFSFFIPGLQSTTLFGGATVLLAERGSERWEDSKLLNLRVAKAFSLGNAGEIEGIVDVTNVFNDDSPTDVCTYPSCVYAVAQENSYGKPSAVVRPRQVRFGLRYTF